jgi:A/G-specific adenine glycosylase
MQKVEVLLDTVYDYYRTSGRAYLPWRQTKNPYRILVSEVMLQQTQVDRVLPKYKLFLKKFPTVSVLAQAPLSEVLLVWSGLGYNRRAKMLHSAAKMVTSEHGGVFPKTALELEALPGVGPYTARAVAIFAFNKPQVCIETNIRTVFTHVCFPKKKIVSDKEILLLIEKTLARALHRGIHPKDFYAALMDYGSYLKKSGVRINNKSAHYAKQSKFEGSARQKRAARLRELLKMGASEMELEKLLHP